MLDAGLVTEVDDVLAAVRDRADALVAGDAERLTAVLHERFVWTSQRGVVFNRASHLAATIGDLTWLAQDLTAVRVIVVGDLAVVTAMVHDVVDRDGARRRSSMRVTQTWTRAGGRWLLLAGHAGPSLDLPVIGTDRLELRPIPVDIARAVLAGRRPDELGWAADYPAPSSDEVMQMVTGGGPGPLGPLFVIRRDDDGGPGAVIGEIGCAVGGHIAVVGYGLVASARGRGYATEALRAVLAAARARGEVRIVVGRTTPDHTASRRVMERSGMTYHGEVDAGPDGETATLVEYRLTFA
jgi:RimJ/RimL family protein N-acetyltransferase